MGLNINKEAVEVAGKTIAMLVFGILAGWMVVRAWAVDDTLLRELVGIAIEAVEPFPAGAPLELLLCFFLGALGATWLFFTLDWRKHVSGIILGVFTAVMLWAVWYLGWGLANVPLSPWNVLAGVVGFIVGAYPHKRALFDQIGRDASEDGFEFPLAIVLLPMVLGGIVLISFGQSLLAGTSIIAADAFVTVGFLYSMLGLVTYSQTVRVMPWGIKQTGKSVGWYGIYRANAVLHDIGLRPSEKLQTFDRNMQNLPAGAHLKEAIPSTTFTDDLKFSVPIGNLLPLRAELALPDLEGEIARDVAKKLQDWGIPKEVLSRLLVIPYLLGDTRLPVIGEWELTESQEALLLARWLRDSEIVPLFIDVSRFYDSNDDTGLDAMRAVAEVLSDEGVHLIPVAAKADTALDRATIREEWLFGNEVDDEILRADGGAVMGGEITSGNEQDGINSLGEMITRDLAAHKIGSQVLNLCDEDQVFPTGMKMRENDKGEMVPVWDEHGNEQTFGFELLAEHVTEVVEDRVYL
ncbi:hypothetical protein [Halorubrum lipolyticum]|uniref:Uncharacterized protein n=1 Tax=Halorubrum lipolyticum DSM 21995 TaxID=1227482 RepID=M0NPB5_9EURY|nr:hypothetical protein [Halorubrum lipolyticum]EMA59611.1 hypothetical protein C469_09816 [Halorubrum lipolyticum DSM 21995]